MRQAKTNKLKQIISLILGIPAAIIMFSEIENLEYWWIQLVAVLVLLIVLKWNNLLDKEAKF